MNKIKTYLLEATLAVTRILSGAAPARTAVLSVPFVLLSFVLDAKADVIVVSTTIQAAVDMAQPGDKVRVPPGTYRENVRVTKDNITIRGGPDAIMDGTGLTGNTGIRVAPAALGTRINGFTLSGLTIQNYSRNGVLLLRVDNFHITDGTYIDNKEYGIFPIQSSGGVVDFNSVSGSHDAGIYVGQSNDVVIKKNQARDCTIGIEIENCSNIDVLKNTAKGNSIGIVVQLRPGLGVTVTSDITVIGNRLIANNRANPVTDPDELLSLLPSGIGFLNVGGDNVLVRINTVSRNNTAGIIVAQLPPVVAALDQRINPFPDNNEIRDNVALQNGDDPDPKIAPLPGSDLLWDFSGVGNCWRGNEFKTSFPALPTCP
jgi:parallel beta-helix repeat protein